MNIDFKGFNFKLIIAILISCIGLLIFIPIINMRQPKILTNEVSLIFDTSQEGWLFISPQGNELGEEVNIEGEPFTINNLMNYVDDMFSCLNNFTFTDDYVILTTYTTSSILIALRDDLLCSYSINNMWDNDFNFGGIYDFRGIVVLEQDQILEPIYTPIYIS
jgi:hypothetical protein